AIFRNYLKRAELPSDCSGNSRSGTTATAMIGISRSIFDMNLTINILSGILVDDIVYVPIIVDSPFEISAFGLDIEFPAYKLTFVGLEKTGLTQNYSNLDATVVIHEYSEQMERENEGSAILRVGGYKTDLTFTPSSGVLITLIFRIKHELADDTQLSITATYDDIKNATVERNSLIWPKTKKIERAEKRRAGKHLNW
ncbi:MAG: cohesin domain-containing protein, partial [Clostridiales bacterium]|nr:cohesin domain-containing protein [Clostridiales bacterium]